MGQGLLQRGRGLHGPGEVHRGRRGVLGRLQRRARQQGALECRMSSPRSHIPSSRTPSRSAAPSTPPSTPRALRPQAKTNLISSPCFLCFSLFAPCFVPHYSPEIGPPTLAEPRQRVPEERESGSVTAGASPLTVLFVPKEGRTCHKDFETLFSLCLSPFYIISLLSPIPHCQSCTPCEQTECPKSFPIEKYARPPAARLPRSNSGKSCASAASPASSAPASSTLWTWSRPVSRYAEPHAFMV